MSPIDDYLDGVAEPHRTTLLTLRERIRAEVPDAVECITYGVPTFKVNGRSVAGFAAYKQHCSYFPMSGAVLPAVADAIVGFGTSSGTLRFPVDEPLSADLVHTLVQARFADIAARGR